MPICPSCSSEKIVKNGRIHNGKQRFKCNECNHQFIETPQNIVIGRQKRERTCPHLLIDRLLLEKISLARIARAAQVSDRWLQTYVDNKYATVPKEIKVTPKKSGATPRRCTALDKGLARMYAHQER